MSLIKGLKEKALRAKLYRNIRLFGVLNTETNQIWLEFFHYRAEAKKALENQYEKKYKSILKDEHLEIVPVAMKVLK